jgi:DNA-binding NtrC family response regulator
MEGFTLLVADDDAPQREMLADTLEMDGYTLLQAADGEAALEQVRRHGVDLLLTDLRMPGLNGVELLREVRQLNPLVQVIVMSAFGSIETAVEAMQQGAYNFIPKPVELPGLRLQIQRALEVRQLQDELRELRARTADSAGGEMIARSDEMRELLGLVARVAPSRASVLILGESGTGKEMVARAIHEASNRSNKAFVAVNIAAIPETLIESELFGHEKGAFTGASSSHAGRFERADGGTLFIDEIGDMPLHSQVKLLRVLQEGTVERVGSESPLPVDVRVIAATHRDLDQAIADGDFREDLFYRLNVVRLSLPPLRRRKSDILPLVEHFIERYARLNEKAVTGVSREALDLLMKHAWPGNVRELENAIEGAVVLTRNNLIGLRDLPASIGGERPMKAGSCFPGDDESLPLLERIERFEKHFVLKALEESGGNKTEAARLLRMSDKNIRDRLKRWSFQDATDWLAKTTKESG